MGTMFVVIKTNKVSEYSSKKGVNEWKIINRLRGTKCSLSTPRTIGGSERGAVKHHTLG